MKRKVLFIAILVMTICVSVKNTDIEAGVFTIDFSNPYFEVKPGQTFELKLDGVSRKKLKWETTDAPHIVKKIKNGKYKALAKSNGELACFTTTYKGVDYCVAIKIFKDAKDPMDVRADYENLKEDYDKLEESYYELYGEYEDLQKKLESYSD